jgi:alpha-beta hydrolase superfamily lysophospholipase
MVLLQQFESSLLDRAFKAAAPGATPALPVFGVGHSNGALLHLLIGSLYNAPTQGNAIISFNNKCACRWL